MNITSLLRNLIEYFYNYDLCTTKRVLFLLNKRDRVI